MTTSKRWTSSDPMTLSDDKDKALHEIAGYLRSLSMGANRAVMDSDGSVQGFYQLTEWLVGLLEIADECDRLVKLSPGQAQGTDPDYSIEADLEETQKA